MSRSHCILVVLCAVLAVSTVVAAPAPATASGDVSAEVAATLAVSFPPKLFGRVRLRIPLEVISVHGCDDDSVPRRTAALCACNGSTRLTIRGRGFRAAVADLPGAQVWLVESSRPGRVTKPPSTADAEPSKEEAAASSASIVRLPCEGLALSPQLPDVLAFCTLPLLTDPTREKLQKTGPYHLQVITADGHTALLRNAVFLERRDRPPTAAAGDEDDTPLQEALRTGDWMSVGIGGLDKQFSELFRRAFSSRSAKSHRIVADIGVQHTKGVLLHGPPGTGKTLTARTLAKLVRAQHVKVVNGPEVMSKFVGDSEKNLRELFAPAIADYERYKERAPLHVLIFDEVDAILRPRGAGDDSSARAVYDGVTTQMLSYMDGINAQSNVLIIGLTNRMDAIDKALLRPGRFEVQIRLTLPGARGRGEIFFVHTQKLRAHRYLDDDVFIEQLAADTTGFSGAEIAGVVRSAVSFALERVEKGEAEAKAPRPAECEGGVPAADGVDVVAAALCSAPPPSSDFRVQKADFRRAIREILAARTSGTGLTTYLAQGVVPYAPIVNNTLRVMEDMATALTRSPTMRAARFALSGPDGSGKTAIAALAARNVRFSYVGIISPETLAGLSASEKIKRINDVFDTALHSPTACVVLDDVDTLIELVGGRATTSLVVELRSLIHRDLARVHGVSSDAKLFIIATSTSDEAYQLLSLQQCEGQGVLSDLSRASVANVLVRYGVFGKDEATVVARHFPPRTPIKRVLFYVEQARSLEGSTGAVERPRSPPAPAGDLTEHPLFPSLWGEAEATSPAGAGAAGGIDGGAEPQRKEAGRIAIDTMKRVLVRFHSYYVHNHDIKLEELSPV